MFSYRNILDIIYSIRSNTFMNSKSIFVFFYFSIEYDAYRTDLELMIQAPRNEATTQRLEEAQLAFEKHKDEFEKLRSDVIVKLKFLDENRVSI